MIEKEAKSPRFVFDNEHFVCIIPFSQDMEYETWILPKKHHKSITELNEFEVFTLAETIKNTLMRLSAAIKPLNYSMYFYLKPTKEKDFHFHVVVNQKTLHTTISEGYGISLNRTSPEEVSKILKGKS